MSAGVLKAMNNIDTYSQSPARKGVDTFAFDDDDDDVLAEEMSSMEVKEIEEDALLAAPTPGKRRSGRTRKATVA